MIELLLLLVLSGPTHAEPCSGKFIRVNIDSQAETMMVRVKPDHVEHTISGGELLIVPPNKNTVIDILLVEVVDGKIKLSEHTVNVSKDSPPMSDRLRGAVGNWRSPTVAKRLHDMAGNLRAHQISPIATLGYLSSEKMNALEPGFSKVRNILSNSLTDTELVNRESMITAIVTVAELLEQR